MATISTYFDSPNRFLRSTNLDRDFADPHSLDAYAVTPFVAGAANRIIDSLRSQSGCKAWRITGDYGVGKSSFALLLAHIFSDHKSKPIAQLLRSGGIQKPSAEQLLTILITADREPIAVAIARAFLTSYGARARPTKHASAVIEAAGHVIKSGRSSDFTSLLDVVLIERRGADKGLALIVDEMGKFLEFAASRPDSEDVYVLQTIAERASRSGKVPFLFVGLLHQGVHAYTEKLPHAQKHEWEKIAGRFEEIVFDQPLVHTAYLVSHALGSKEARLPPAIRQQGKKFGKATIDAGLFNVAPVDDWSVLYPLHPTLLPVLVRFFARFGQHERSLFGFLLSNEPHGLQDFSKREAGPHNWYRLSHFFDYVRSVFGHRLTGDSYRNSWLRLVEAVDRGNDLPPEQVDIVKTIAILNLLDVDDILPNAQVLQAATSQQELNIALKALTENGRLFRRGNSGGYRLWPGTSVNLHQALADAYASMGELDGQGSAFIPYLESSPIAARRHYLKTGTLRYFELRFVSCADLGAEIETQSDADGKVVVAMPTSEIERKFAMDIASRARRDDVIMLIPAPLDGLAPLLRDIKAWESVQRQTLELSSDSFAADEVDRQLKLAIDRLSRAIDQIIGVRSQLASAIDIFLGGKKVSVENDFTLARLISQACDKVFCEAPFIHNELLNRNVLSSAASAARMRLVEGMFTSPSLDAVGIETLKAPPERSMYLSVLERGNVHLRRGSQFLLEEPDVEADNLRLLPALNKIIRTLESADGAQVSIDDISRALESRPLGIRSGVIPLLLAIVLCTRSHEIAVYENGTYSHNFGPADFLRLAKQPALFSLQLCRVAGVRADVFRKLLQYFAPESEGKPASDLLDVVAPLCKFVAQLPEYTRRSLTLDPVALAVRDALLVGTDPSDLLFNTLPRACGIKSFGIADRKDTKKSELFVATLRKATTQLRDAYADLLAEISRDAVQALGAGGTRLDRAKLASRAARVVVVAREGRLKAFAQRLRDPGLSDDAWLESLASFVLSKPPQRWFKTDKDNWTGEIADLGALFCRTEAAAYANGSSAVRGAVRIGLTRADGTEVARVVEIDRSNSGENVAHAIQKMLPTASEERLTVLYLLLWEALKGEEQLSAPSQSISAEPTARS